MLGRRGGGGGGRHPVVLQRTAQNENLQTAEGDWRGGGGVRGENSSGFCRQQSRNMAHIFTQLNFKTFGKIYYSFAQ
jgi:hypothetical protein